MARKRFYKLAAATPEHGVTLDGKPIKTPAKRTLVLPTAALAEAIAAEWEGQGDVLNAETMLLTKLANTALDRVGPDRTRILDEIAEYAGSDVVCYRADHPPRLVAAQQAAWDPVLAWARTTLQAHYTVVTGIMHQAQPAEALAAVRAHFAQQSDFRLTALHNIMTLTGSALLAAMAGAGAIPAEAAWTAAHVDEDYQIAEWGADDEACARRAAREAEFHGCLRFLALARR